MRCVSLAVTSTEPKGRHPRSGAASRPPACRAHSHQDLPRAFAHAMGARRMDNVNVMEKSRRSLRRSLQATVRAPPPRLLKIPTVRWTLARHCLRIVPGDGATLRDACAEYGWAAAVDTLKRSQKRTYRSTEDLLVRDSQRLRSFTYEAFAGMKEPKVEDGLGTTHPSTLCAF